MGIYYKALSCWLKSALIIQNGLNKLICIHFMSRRFCAGLLLVLGLLSFLPDVALAQGTHPSCYYYPPNSCPPPPAPPQPTTNENPSLDGSYQVSISNGDPYSWIEWNTGQTGTLLNITDKASGTYTYSAKRCINTGSNNICSGYSPSITVYVLRTPGTPAFGSISSDACAGSLSVSWFPGTGYPAGSTIYYDLQESINGSGWITRLLGTTLTTWSRSAAESDTYQYRVRSRYYLSGYYSDYTAWISNSNFSMPACTDDSPIPQPLEPASDFVGSIEGSFNVTPSGAAGYSIPLEVPPGIGGIVPKLSLDYHSQGGAGFVGAGWSLGGLSAITRCAATLEPDGFVDGVDFKNNDRFCLDGKKLILVPGTGNYGAAGSEYRTEIDGFSKIIAAGSAGSGPSSFIVRASTGQEMLYGSRIDARIEAQGRSEVMTWALNTVTDSSGNRMEFFYTVISANMEYVPLRVEYSFSGGISGARVQFGYGTQSSSTMYIAGSTVRNTRLLETVKTYVGTAQAVKEYRLQYEMAPATGRPRLKELTECSLVSGTVCLEPTLFTWYGAQTPMNTQNFGNLRTSDNVGWDGAGQWPIDVDGDGRQELVYNQAGTSEYYYVKKTGSSTWSTVFWANRQHGVKEAFQHWPMDVNGDGLIDLVFMRDGSLEYWVILNKGDGTTTVKLWGTRSQITAAYNGKAWPMDVNGDGRTDLVYVKQGPINPRTGYVERKDYYALIAQDGSVASDVSLGETPEHQAGLDGHHWVMDVNSDGRSDLVFVEAGTRNYYALINNNGSLSIQFWITRIYDANYEYAHWPFDANGDGLLDLVYSRSDTSDYRVLLNKGNGVAIDQYFATRQEAPGWDGAHWAIDVNADGILDLVYNKLNTHDYYAMVSWPDGSRVRQFWGSKNFTVGFDGKHIEMDADGDGFTELLANVHNTKQYKTLGIQSSFDLLSAITDGYGNVTSIQYRALNDGAVYSRVENPYNQYPTAAAVVPMRVVSKVTVPDGVGGTRNTQYFYKKLKINHSGRGSLGFAEVISTDTQSNIRVETKHNQAFPQTGLVSESIRCLYTGGSCAADKILQKTANTYATQTTVNGPGLADTVFVYPSQSVETMYALDNETNTTSELATITTTNANPDTYGNMQLITVINDSIVNTDYYKTKTDNLYYNDTINWHLGLLTSSTVTKYLDGGVATDANSVRRTAFEYFPTTNLLKKEIVEPGPPYAEPITRITVYERDSYGNITKMTSCATDFANCGVSGQTGPSILPFRTVTTVYDPFGQFPQSVTNAMGESESYVYDRKFGVKLSLTGPNGLVTNWSYDSFGKLLKETRPGDVRTVTTYKWCAAGVCPQYSSYYVVTQNTGAAPVTEYFDAQGRKLRIRAVGFNGRNIHTDTVYNDLGQVVQVSEPYFEDDISVYWTQSTYDLIGRVVSVTPPLSPVVSTDYNLLTTTMSRTVNGVLRTESETRNIIGQTVSVTNPAGTILLYTYDSQGNLKTTMTQGYSNTLITVTYDLLGRKTQVVDPDMGTWTYQYNGFGDLVSQTNALNQTVTMKYDKLGRLKERNEPEGQTLWVYGSSASAHNIGKLVSISGPNGLSTKTMDYDSLGRPSQTTTQINIAPYTSKSYVTGQTYDSAGRIKTVLYPNVGGSRFQVKNHYNPQGYLSKVTSLDGITVYWRAQEMNARGQLEMALLGNGASVQNIYTPQTGWLEGTMVDATDLIYHMGYELDEVGNIKSRTDHRQSLTENFQYDILDQLTNSNVNAGSAKSYVYNALGNIISKTGVGSYTYGTCSAGSRSAGPHAVCQAGSATYAYNANGSMTSGDGRTISYYSFNLPYQFVKGTTTINFRYGPDRSRVFRSDGSSYTSYIGMTDTGNALYEHEVQGTTEKHLHFIYAGGQALAVHTIQTGPSPLTKTEYLHRDHLGSVEAVSNSSGVAIAYYSHDAWGKPRNTNWTDATASKPTPAGRLGFTGHEMIPEVGLIHMNGRVYDPSLGKFLSADSTVQFEKDVRSYNRYSYVSNNPLRYTDPTGYSLGSFLGGWLRKHAMTILNVVSWFYKPLAPFVMALNVVSIGYYASSAQQMAGGLLAMYLGGKAGDKAVAALGEGAKEFTKAIIRGGTSGAVNGGANSMLMGGKIGRGIMQGMAVGAATAAIEWAATNNNPAQGAGKDTAGKNPFDTSREVGQVAGGSYRRDVMKALGYGDPPYGWDFNNDGYIDEGWVIGPKGIPQLQIGAETELMYGSQSDMTYTPIPGNTYQCENVCTAIGFAIGGDINKAYQPTTETLDTISKLGKAFPDIDVRNLVGKFGLLGKGLEITTRAFDLPQIRDFCQAECSKTPIDKNFERY